MSIFSRLAAVALGAALLMAGSAASAARYIVSFSGVMESGTDSGLFGSPSDLTGKSFVASYTYSIVNGELYYEDPGVHQIAVVGKPSLTIGGSTYLFPAYSMLGQYANAYDGSLYFWYQSLIDANPLDNEFIGNPAVSPLLQPDLTFGLGLGESSTIAVSGGGGFYIHVCCGGGVEEIKSSGTFITDKVTITAVPEPATWVMMIVGFGFAGAALRRRRSMAAASSVA